LEREFRAERELLGAVEREFKAERELPAEKEFLTESKRESCLLLSHSFSIVLDCDACVSVDEDREADEGDEGGVGEAEDTTTVL